MADATTRPSAVAASPAPPVAAPASPQPPPAAADTPSAAQPASSSSKLHESSSAVMRASSNNIPSATTSSTSPAGRSTQQNTSKPSLGRASNAGATRSSKLGVPTRGPSTTSSSAGGGGGGHHRKKLGHHGSSTGRSSAQQAELIPEKPKIRIPAHSVVPIPELGEYSQQQFALRKGKDIADWQPRKLVSRDALLADISSIGYISDFFPLRELIQRYPGKEMLIYYDPAATQEISNNGVPCSEYLLATHELTKQFLTTRQLNELPRQVIDFGGQALAAIRAQQSNKKWQSYGSEKEIVDDRQLQAVGKFGKMVMLDFTTRITATSTTHALSNPTASQQQHTQLQATYWPQTHDWRPVGGAGDKKFNLLVNVHVDADEAIPDAVPIRLVDSCCQTNDSSLRRHTKASETENSQMPKISVLVQAALDPLTQAERETILCKENFFDFLSKSVDKLSPIIKQNCLADYYYDEWEELPEEEDYLGKSDSGELKEVLALIDLSTRREDLVSHVDVHLGLPDIVFVSLAFPGTFDERSQRYKQIMLQENVMTVFSCWDPIRPIMHMYSPDEVQVFAVNPSNPFLVAGGCANGQLVIWDMRPYQARLLLQQKKLLQDPKKQSINYDPSNEAQNEMPMVEYTVISDIEKSHKMAITDLHWLPPNLELDERGNQYDNEDNFSYQIITASADSSVAVWDIRPTHVQQILPQLVRKGARQFAPNENLDELSDSLKGLSTLSRQLKPFMQIQFKLDQKRPAPFTKINLLETAAYTRLKQHIQHDDLDDVSSTTAEGENNNSDHPPVPVPVTPAQPPQKGQPQQQQQQVATTMHNNPLLRLPLSRRGRQWHQRRSDTVHNNTFWFGTEYGELAYGRLVPTMSEDNTAQIPSLPLFTAALHDGPITCIERSPFVRNIIIVTGGYTFSIWRDDHVSGPLMQSPVRVKRLNAAIWSSTRPAVFYVARLDGQVEVWDLLDRTDECVRTQSIASVAITCLTWASYGERRNVLACADQSGATHLVEVPRVYRVPVANERQKVHAFFERELERQTWAKVNLERIRVQMEKEKAAELLAAAAAATTTATTQGGAGDGPVAAASPSPASAVAPTAAVPSAPKKPVANMDVNEMLDNLMVDDEVMTQFCNKLWTNFQAEKRQWEQELGIESERGVGGGDDEADDEERPTKSTLPSQMSVAQPSGKSEAGQGSTQMPASLQSKSTVRHGQSSVQTSKSSRHFDSSTQQQQQQLLDIIPDVINDVDLPKRVESFSELSGNFPAVTIAEDANTSAPANDNNDAHTEHTAPASSSNPHGAPPSVDAGRNKSDQAAKLQRKVSIAGPSATRKR